MIYFCDLPFEIKKQIFEFIGQEYIFIEKLFLINKSWNEIYKELIKECFHNNYIIYKNMNDNEKLEIKKLKLFRGNYRGYIELKGSFNLKYFSYKREKIDLLSLSLFLKDSPNLKSIKLNGYSDDSTDQLLITQLKTWKYIENITTLFITGGKYLLKKENSFIPLLKNLKILNINTKTNEKNEIISILEKLTNLESIRIISGSIFSDEIYHINNNLTSLQILNTKINISKENNLKILKIQNLSNVIGLNHLYKLQKLSIMNGLMPYNLNDLSFFSNIISLKANNIIDYENIHLYLPKIKYLKINVQNLRLLLTLNHLKELNNLTILYIYSKQILNYNDYINISKELYNFKKLCEFQLKSNIDNSFEKIIYIKRSLFPNWILIYLKTWFNTKKINFI
jgi:hypothetical protein